MTRRLALGLGLALTVALLAVLGLPGQPLTPVPVVPDDLLPGRPAPAGLVCDFYEPDPTWRDCQNGQGVDVAIQDGLIRHSYLFTYGSGLRVGDVVAAWGQPTWADYGGYGAVEVGWAAEAAQERWLYVLGEPFSPFSQVGFIAYGAPYSRPQAWRGYRNQP